MSKYAHTASGLKMKLKEALAEVTVNNRAEAFEDMIHVPHRQKIWTRPHIYRNKKTSSLRLSHCDSLGKVLGLVWVNSLQPCV